MCRVANHQSRLPRATSSLALDAPSLDAFTTYLGNLFQCITTLWVKNFLLISNLNLPCLSLKPFPLVLHPAVQLRLGSAGGSWPGLQAARMWELPAATSLIAYTELVALGLGEK